ncbi:phosphotransferase enzyme family protein [Aestuariimicrobium soli]|uniref:phosphotransferase enzyme family protein n=1 Tax=Aestuariimicrobium soli TaxID=2035834 RepID=UPI003EBE481E
MDDITIEGWPDRGFLATHWPQLGTIHLAQINGGGLRLDTEAGFVHLKKRPRTSIQAETWILEQLTEQGVPVPDLVPTATGAKHVMFGHEAVLVYAELPGAAWGDYTAPDAGANMRKLGAAAASLHLAMAEIDVTGALARGLHVRQRRRGTEGLPVQIIHRDYHAGNVLFDGEVVTGYIDSDHLELGPRWVDPLYGSLSGMARLFEVGREAEWLPLFEEMVAGYHAVSPVTPLEAERTVELMIGIEEDFLAWFLRDQDEQNALLTVLMIERVHRQRDEINEAVARAMNRCPARIGGWIPRSALSASAASSASSV